jgi:hypothetical protein
MDEKQLKDFISSLGSGKSKWISADEMMDKYAT